MLKVSERNDETPVCPHCNTSIDELWCRELRSSMGRRYVYFCAKCRKVLGVSHRKGFWMG